MPNSPYSQRRLEPLGCTESFIGAELKESGASSEGVAQLGWEQRGTHQYYYRKEREGSRVKSVYVGRGEIANMISQIQSGSSVMEKLVRQTNIANQISLDKAVLVFEKTIKLLTHAALLAAGFHTHHRQWRRKRNVDSD